MPERNSSEGPEVIEAQIEDYLDHLFAPLVGTMPYEKREEMRAEMRTHLHTRVAAYRELGEEEETATASALHHFGAPEAISRACCEEYGLSARPATLLALRLFGISTAIAAFTVPYIFVYCTPGRFVVATLCALIFGMPTAVGLAVGWQARSRPALGSLYGLLLAIPITTFLNFLLLIYLPVSNDWNGAGGPLWMQGLGWGLYQIWFWIPLGCGAASFGHWLRRWKLRRSRKRLA